MSKYTTEVRFICEEAAGLKESKGYNDVNEIVAEAYPKIFDNSLVFYNEETKSRLLPKILLHYYQREIGFETVGLWKLKLNQKMREILPYYNQLYASEDLEFNPLQNVDNQHTHSGSHGINKQNSNNKSDDYTTTHNLTEAKDFTETRDLTTVDDGSSSFERSEDTILRHVKTTTHGDDINTHAIDSPLDHWNMFSDTPQGGIDGVQLAGGSGTSGTLSDNAYLTNATHITESPAATHDTLARGDITEAYNVDGDNADNVATDGWDKTDNTNTHSGTVRNAGSTDTTGTIRKAGETVNSGSAAETGTEAYTKTESGKIGVMTYQEMVMKWRESFLNIDMQIINELGDLFMKVW